MENIFEGCYYSFHRFFRKRNLIHRFFFICKILSNLLLCFDLILHSILLVLWRMRCQCFEACSERRYTVEVLLKMLSLLLFGFPLESTVFSLNLKPKLLKDQRKGHDQRVHHTRRTSLEEEEILLFLDWRETGEIASQSRPDQTDIEDTKDRNR